MQKLKNKKRKSFLIGLSIIIFSFLLLPKISFAAGICECDIVDDVEKFSERKIVDVKTREECINYKFELEKESVVCRWYDEKENNVKTFVLDLDISDLNQLSVQTPQAFIGLVIKSIMGILGTITLIMIIYGGIIWMTSAGNTDKTKKARDIIIWASLGIVVIFASYAILNTILNIFSS